MRSSFQELFSRFMNKSTSNCLCSKKELNEFGIHSCDSNAPTQIADIFKMISNPSPSSSPCRKKTESENRRPSDEENFCPFENNHLSSNKKQSKLKKSNSNEFFKTKRIKITDDELSPKEHRKKRDKPRVVPDTTPRRTSPSTQHRRSGSVDGNCLRKKDNKSLQNGISRTHSHSINSQNSHVTHEARSQMKSCPTLRPVPSPSPDLPPKHPSHLSKHNHRHKQNGTLLTREPSLPPNEDKPLDENSTQGPLEVLTSAERESIPETTKPVDVRRVLLSIRKRSAPTTPLIHRIYSENKKKVESVTSRDLLQTSNIITYRQPCEAPRYYNSIFSYKQRRPQFIQLLQNRLIRQYKKERLLCVEQDSLREIWESSLQEASESENKKSLQNRMKEQYERFYPEIKRQREQERTIKVIGESEVCEENSLEKHESVAATIPAMVTERREKEIKFSSRNGYIGDLTKFTEDKKYTNIWKEEEKVTFKEKIYQYPKNFEVIASYLNNKSVADCIKYYYLNKKLVNFKHSVRGSNVKRRKNRLQPKDLYLYVRPRGPSMTSPDQSSLRHRRSPDWTPEEVEKLRNAIRKHGRSWNKIQQVVGKPLQQCKLFYNDFSSFEEYGLQQAMDERIRRKAKERQDKMSNCSEDPLKFQEDNSDRDSPHSELATPPSDSLPPKEDTSHLREHSYHAHSAQAATNKVCPTALSGMDSTKLTMLSAAKHTQLMKVLRESCRCRSDLPRVKRYRRNSAAALLQPSNHRRLSAGQSGAVHKRAALVLAERTRVSQERSASDTCLEVRPKSREVSSPVALTPTEPAPHLVSSEVVTEADTPTTGPPEKREQRNSSDYDSDQEGGRLVIDIDADDVIEEQAQPATQGGSFTSLPDLERVEDQEVFQSDETSELSPDVITELSPARPIQARFEDAWAYRSHTEFQWPDPVTTSFQFEDYEDREPESLAVPGGDRLVERIGQLSIPRSDRPPKKWNHASRVDTHQEQRNAELPRPIPIKPNHKYPKASIRIEIQRGLKLLEQNSREFTPQQNSQEVVWGDPKRNGHSPPRKEHKRLKSEAAPQSNGHSVEDEQPEGKESVRLQYLAQCRPELYQQQGMLPYPALYHPLGQFLLQNPYLSPPLLPPTGKLILPSGIQFPITSSVSHSYPPPLLLQGSGLSGLYPMSFSSAPPPDGPSQPHENPRGPKSNT